MAAYVPVPRDLSKVKTKLFWNLTRRQLICFSIAAAIGIPSFLAIRHVSNASLACMCMIFIMMPMFLLAMYEKDGQPLEVIARHYIERGLTTSSTAIFIPYTTQELFQDRPEALYYGRNALSGNLIMGDRKTLKTPNGLILGTPGSGKSFSAKREISNVFLATDDDIIVCDPESEYTALVKRLNGQVIKISPNSTHFINPMDINLNYSEDAA